MHLQDMSGRKVMILAFLCAVITSGLGLGVKNLMTDSPEEAWHNFSQQIDREHAKGVYPFRLDFYTVVQDARIDGQTLNYTYAIENIRLTDISLKRRAEHVSPGSFVPPRWCRNMVCGWNMIIRRG